MAEDKQLVEDAQGTLVAKVGVIRLVPVQAWSMVQGYVYMYNYIDSQGDPLLPPTPPPHPPPQKVKATKMKASIIYHQ